MTLVQWLEGKKTYIVAIALYAYAVGGYLSGNLSASAAIGYVFSSGGLAALRGALAQVFEYIQTWEAAAATPAVEVPPTPAPAPTPASVMTAEELQTLIDLATKLQQSVNQSPAQSPQAPQA